MSTSGLSVELHQAGPIPLAARFDCAPGELLALVGPSGSGKTTLLRAIAGLYRPRAGQVQVDGDLWFDGVRKFHLPPHRRRVGLVFQSFALFPHLSALGNVLAALGHRPQAERRPRAEALLESVNLSGFEGRLPAQLSGGQQQRVAVARALARDPRVLLLDEPFTAVDRATRERLYLEIAELRRSLEIPVVLVTHDLDEGLMLADRVAVLHRGRILQTGPPGEILTRPISPEVARLVHLRNLFEGVVMGRQPETGKTLLEWTGVRLEVTHGGPFALGARVTWVIPGGFVVLQRPDRPVRSGQPNCLPGVVTALVTLGQTAHLTFLPQASGRLPIHFSIPLYVVRRHGIAAGVAATVSLLPEGIHLMPWAAAPERSR